jgi:hypothetical protein
MPGRRRWLTGMSTIIRETIMSAITKIAIGILTATLSAGLYAQETMTAGELKAKDAKQLSKDELVKLLSGHDYLQTGSSYQQRWTLSPDGTSKGSSIAKVQSVMQPPAGGEAKWSVNDQAEFCIDGKWYFRNPVVTKFCQNVYQIGDGYYRVSSRAPDSTPAVFFEVK